MQQHTYGGTSFDWETKDISNTPSAILRVPESWLANLPKPAGANLPAGLIPPQIIGYTDWYISSYKRVVLKNPKILQGTPSPNLARAKVALSYPSGDPLTCKHRWHDTGMAWTYCDLCPCEGRKTLRDVVITRVAGQHVDEDWWQKKVTGGS